MEYAVQQQNITKPSSKKGQNFFGKKNESPFFTAVPIQLKLIIGPADDPYEREADAIADKVMRMSDVERLPTKASPVILQRRCAKCEDEEKIQPKISDVFIQRSPESDSPVNLNVPGDWEENHPHPPYLKIQLTIPSAQTGTATDMVNYGKANMELIQRGNINPADYTIPYAALWNKNYQLSTKWRLGNISRNLYEKGDALLKPIRGLINKLPLAGSFLSSKVKLDKPDLKGGDWDRYIADKLSLSGLGGAVDRDNPAYNTGSGFTYTVNVVDIPFDENKIIKRIFRKPVNNSYGMTAPSIVDDVISGEGQSLDAGTRSFMESRFGYDFGDVQIHNNSLAHQSSREINAMAYTHGNHIVFAGGQYQPSTQTGKQLLAHELAHVLQQDNSVSRQVIRRYAWPYARHLNKEVKENISETISNAPAGSEAWNGTFYWDALFRIELNAMVGEVWMIVRLSSPAPLAVRKSWERAIERKWSNRLYLRVTPPGSKQGPCKFLIKADIRWVTDPAKAHHTITPKKPGDTCDGRVGLNDTCSMTDWGTGDTTDITHEFGHMLGNAEEYFTTNGINYAVGGKAGFRDPGGGVMNNPAERAHRRHFNLLRAQVAKMLGLTTSDVRVIYNNEAIPACAADIGDFPQETLSKENAIA